MQDRLSVMLDSMIIAVDEGLSYDGIVSLPDAGLEDFGRRPGIAGWLDDSVEAFRTTKATISRVVDKLRSKVVPSNRTQRGSNRNSWVRPSVRDSRASNRISVADSKFTSDDGKRPTSLVVPSSQDSSTPVNSPPLQNPAVMQEEHATPQYITVSLGAPRLRRPPSRGSPSAALRDSVITVASRASHVDEESSERIQSQHSPVGSLAATRRTRSPTPRGSAASRAAPVDTESSQKDTVHSRHGLQDPQASYAEEEGPHKDEAVRSPHSREQTLAQEDPQVSHIDIGGESSQGDTSQRDPRKKTAPQDIVVPASHSDEESLQKAEDAHTQRSPVTIPVPPQETQSSASRDLVPSQPRKPREAPSPAAQEPTAPPASLDAGTQNDETIQAQHSPDDAQRLPRLKDKQE